jgi:hypothetical protein
LPGQAPFGCLELLLVLFFVVLEFSSVPFLFFPFNKQKKKRKKEKERKREGPEGEHLFFFSFFILRSWSKSEKKMGKGKGWGKEKKWKRQNVFSKGKATQYNNKEDLHWNFPRDFAVARGTSSQLAATQVGGC